MIEAMARGLPIVATDAGGTRDLCGPCQQRYIVDREDSAAFVRSVVALLASPGERKTIAAENLVSVRRYDSVNVALMYDAALSPLIGASKASQQ
jgi:glycosyltransferase involved in cell wall biosynthesis